MRTVLLALLSLTSCATADPGSPPLRLTWDKNMLGIHSPELPGGKIDVWYLEAYCRPGSTNRDWKKTVIPHRTEKLEESADGRLIRLRCRVEGGVVVDHEIRAGDGEVSFDLVAVNRGPARVDAVWVQPCVRLKDFTGRDQKSYVERSFIFVDGKRTFLHEARRTEEAVYKGGQVYVPAGIDRADVNPRPLSPDVPSNGLIGCLSADGKKVFATAWEPYQELFQGVIVCLHSDFRLGGLDPGETKRARGRIYVMDDDVEALLDRYLRDFPEARRP
jgi:hypothetical protein